MWTHPLSYTNPSAPWFINRYIIVGFVEVAHRARAAAAAAVAGTERWTALHAEPPDVGGVVDHATLCHEWRLLMEDPAPDPGSNVAAPDSCRLESPDAGMETPDYYMVLGIGEGAPPADLKKAYRKAAMRFSPDPQ